jgi:ferric-dicitrate binding protein FerR (iron transport regulator)
MSHPWDWDFLIHRHLAGEELTEEQRTALNERLRKFPRLRKRLAEMAFEQANLRDALTVSEAVPILIVSEPAAAAPLLKPSPELVGPKPRPWILPVAAAAACLAIIVGIGVWSASGPAAPFKVVAGDVKVDGSRVEVAGAAPALFKMSDGSEAELAPSSAAVFHGREGDARQVVELSRGTGRFKVAKAPDSFRVDTSVGTVSVLGTEFSVELRKQKKGPPALAVSVVSGRVRVEAAGQKGELGPGESRVFGVEPPPEKKDPPAEKKEPRIVFSGTVRGRVVGKGDAHILLAVDTVVSSRKESSAELAEGLPGRTLRITPLKRKDLDLGFDKVQFLFLRKLEIGQELSVDVRQLKGDEFTVGALTEEQVQWAAPREDRPEKKKPKDPEKGPDRGDKKED